MDGNAPEGPFVVVCVADCRRKEPFEIVIFLVFFLGPSADGLVELSPDAMVYGYAGPLEGRTVALDMAEVFLVCYALWVKSFTEAAFIVVYYAP